MNPINFLRFLGLPFLVYIGYYIGGWGNYLTPVICFILHPFLQLIHLPKKQVQKKENQFNKNLYQRIALLFVPVLAFTSLWALYIISQKGSPDYEVIGLCLSVGTVNGILGFTLAHEFIHKHDFTSKFGGLLLLLLNNYLHYEIEHIGGHHVYACTPRDPHTARLGESFYHFFPRAIYKTFINAWQIEITILKKKNYKPLSIHNRFIVYLFIELFFLSTIYFLAGPVALTAFLFTAFTAVFLLHITNYLQHYGLMRKEISEKKYERINAQHAWGNERNEDGLSLFQVERHADHHLHPTHSYEELEEHEESPLLPGSYSVMICLALVPPLWYKTIHPRIPSPINQLS